MIVREHRPVPQAPRADRRMAELEAKRARLRALKAAQHGVESFEDFVHRVMPGYWPVPEHLRPLYDLIQRSRFEQVRALVSMPPRHGKTETLRLGLAYRVLYDPACQNAYATFASDLSEETGRAVRQLVRNLGIGVGKTAGYTAKGGSGKVLDWKTAQGGGLKATSVGGSITGRGINSGLLIIDDPIKGREAAYSLGERNRVWGWLRSDILSRLEGGGSCIIVQTRWHEDDPIGRMLAGGDDWEPGLGEEWVHINLPAIGDAFGNPVDERQDPPVVKPLWTSINARFPDNTEASLAWYRTCRARGEFEWWSLYQGVPRSADRKVFAEDPAVYQLPIALKGKRCMIMLDPAATAKTSSDFSALGVGAMTGFGDRTIEVVDRRGNKTEIVNPNPSTMELVEMWKDRWPVPKVINLARKWQLKYNLPVGVECDGTAANLPDWVRTTEPRMRIVEILTGGRDKYTRAIPGSKAWNDGRILVPAGVDVQGNETPCTWHMAGARDPMAEFLRVMKAFTGLGDKEDDVVDVVSHLWNRLYKEWKPRDRMGAIVAPAY